MGGNWHGYNLDFVASKLIVHGEARQFVVNRQASMTNNSVASSGEDDVEWEYSLKPNEIITETDHQASHGRKFKSPQRVSLIPKNQVAPDAVKSRLTYGTSQTLNAIPINVAEAER